MVQIIPRPESSSDRFAKAFSNLGSSLSQSIPQELMGRRERADLSELMGRDVKNIRNPDLLKQLLQSHLSKEEQTAKLKGEYEADADNYNRIKNAFGEKFAEVWLASPTGARTALTHAALEARARGIDLDQMLGMMQQEGQLPQQEIPEQQMEMPVEEEVANQLQNLKAEQDEGLLPAEKIARGKERFSTGLKDYQEAGSKLRAFAADKERIGVLEDLEKTKKLPKGLGRINVDKDGNLRLPFLGSPEAQRFVKTLNEFSAGAKDTFGARVTNFDLIQYLRRYPTLLNTAEGRRQLYQQMKLVNQINSVYYKNLKKVYDDSGGVRNIDADVAERLAEKLSEPKVNQLSSKFREIGQFSSKPSAAEFKGRKIVDEKTGEIFISDGNEWVPAE